MFLSMEIELINVELFVHNYVRINISNLVDRGFYCALVHTRQQPCVTKQHHRYSVM